MKKGFFITQIVSIFFVIFSFPIDLKSEIINKSEDIILLKNLVRNSEYILGPGDELYLRFFGAKDFSGEVNIINDGTISIPIIGDTFVSGLTKKMAEEKIEKLLEPHLIQKDVQVLIINPRKIKVAVIGEVVNPGIYSMTEEETSFTFIEDSLNPITIKGVPTLVDAIQKSGGLTNTADITNVLIKRKLPSKKEISSYKLAYSNLVKLVENGDFDQNPVLFDGDVITVKKEISSKKVAYKNWGNLSPYKIDVIVTGEVVNPGLIKIPSSSSLQKVILAAGGPKNFRAKKNNIKILRENDEGNYIIENYNFKLTSNLKKEDLPIIKDGDVVFVDSNNIAKTGDAIKLITSPFFGMHETLKFLKLLNSD